MSKLVKTTGGFNDAAKRVNSDFNGCTTEDILGTVAITKKYSDHCNKLFRLSKSKVERHLDPSDIEKVLTKSTSDSTVYEGKITAVNTLFGAEYIIGRRKWVICNSKVNSASRTLLDAAASDPKIRDILIKHKILVTEPTIDYKAIHAIIDPLGSKADLPAELDVLLPVINVVDSDKTIVISTIKNDVTAEEIAAVEE